LSWRWATLWTSSSETSSRRSSSKSS
jgi:hypothetical protein